MRSQIWRQNETLVAITIVLLCIVIGVINPVFFTTANLFNLLRGAIVMGILAMGVLLVIVSGGIDVSFTAVAIFAMYTTVEFFRDYFPEAPLVLMFAMSGAIGMLLGAINGFFIAQFKLPTLIVTLGTLSMFRGFLLFAIGNRIIRDVPPAMTAFARSSLWDVEMANGGIAKLQPGILVTIGVALATWLLLRYTMLGRSIFALGGAREAAERAGFNVKRVQYFIYITVGLLAGIGGMMFGALSRQANPQDIAGTELDVIAAVVLGGASLTGGRGTVFGTLLGVALVVIMTNSLILMGVPSTWQRVVIGAIILIGTGIPAIQAKRARRRISSVTLEQPAQA